MRLRSTPCRIRGLKPGLKGWLHLIIRVVKTVENEYPFLSYIEESGGPSGLGRLGEVVVYTAGYPTPALAGALSRLAAARPDLCFSIGETLM